jgi:hypothetical protein
MATASGMRAANGRKDSISAPSHTSHIDRRPQACKVLGRDLTKTFHVKHFGPIGGQFRTKLWIKDHALAEQSQFSLAEHAPARQKPHAFGSLGGKAPAPPRHDIDDQLRVRPIFELGGANKKGTARDLA